MQLCVGVSSLSYSFHEGGMGRGGRGHCLCGCVWVCLLFRIHSMRVGWGEGGGGHCLCSCVWVCLLFRIHSMRVGWVGGGGGLFVWLCVGVSSVPCSFHCWKSRKERVGLRGEGGGGHHIDFCVYDCVVTIHIVTFHLFRTVNLCSGKDLCCSVDDVCDSEPVFWERSLLQC